MMALLFGPPGVGKGTQADLLAKNGSFIKFSTGDMLREEVASKSSLGNDITSFLDRGVLVPDNMISTLARQFIENHGKDDILLDGFPRNLNQAQTFTDDLKGMKLSLAVAIEMHLDEAELIKRLMNRRYCPQCNKIYNYITNPPRKEQLCDICGIALVKRSDDNESVIRRRLDVYEKETRPLVGYYTSHSIYERIDATGSQEAVYKKISLILDAHTN
ncbi:MAG: adenylate kinase [bacterium]